MPSEIPRRAEIPSRTVIGKIALIGGMTERYAAVPISGISGRFWAH